MFRVKRLNLITHENTSFLSFVFGSGSLRLVAKLIIKTDILFSKQSKQATTPR